MAIKIGFMGDPQLGERKFRKLDDKGNNKYETINYDCFKESFKIFKENNVDKILITGDLFDSPNPSLQATLIALEEFKNFDGEIYIIGGNHDFSQKFFNSGYHPFMVFDHLKNVHTFYNGFDILDFKDFDLTVIPYKYLNYETYGKIYKGDLSSKEKPSLLMIHGYVDLLGEEYKGFESFNRNIENEEREELYFLPKEVAKNYDLVICGHIHLPNLVKTESTSILTCGSLMPSPRAKDYLYDSPRVYITEVRRRKLKDIEEFNLEMSPKVFHIYTDDVNKDLEKIANLENEKRLNDIYFIRYSDRFLYKKSSDSGSFDEFLYKKAQENCLNLAIQTTEIRELTESEKVSDFWSFIKENYNEYYNEFKNIISEQI